MIKLNNPSLLSFFKKNDYNVELQQETDQVLVTLNISGQEFPMFVRALDEGHLLQLITFIPCQMKPELAPDIARLLLMLNKELDLPGFGMDETAHAMFYRVVLPATDKTIAEKLLKLIISTIQHVCGTFSNPIAAVALGYTKLEDVLKKAQEIKKP